MMFRLILVCCFFLSLMVPSLDGAEPRGSITIERIAAIRHPSDASWSPPGDEVAFLWDSAGNQNLFIVAPGEAPRALTSFGPDPDDWSGDIDGFSWISSDTILFLHRGQVWSVPTSSESSGPRELEGLEGVSAFTVSSDRKRVAFIAEDRLFASDIDGRFRKEVTVIPDGRRATGLVFSPDGRHIALISSSFERAVDILRYNGGKQGLYRNVIGDFAVGIVSSEGGSPRWLAVDGSPSALQWAGSDSVLFQRISPDMKTREILVASLDGSTRTLRRDHDARWWSPIRRDNRTVVSPDGTLVAFFADETGWSHLYVMPTDGSGQAKQLTSGQFEAGFGSWSPDGTRIAFYDNASSPMERFVRVVDVGSGAIESIVTRAGVNYWPRFSPDGRKLVLERTDVENSVDLYVAEVTPNAPLDRLTHSMPDSIRKSDLTAPVPVHFPSRVDGASVPGSLFVPQGLDRSQKHPAIVWIHGSGSDQNFLGWHPFSYRMYYSATQYLVQQGYVVLTVDYRGSSGYGRDWGTGHHLDLGGPDALDVASGADYLKGQSYIDPDRIGV